MDQDELIAKLKGLISDGKMDEAKSFLADHQADLGEYYDKAKDLISGDGTADAVDKLKGFFGK
ncbi:hypothetical protein IV38_GL001824 [Lactobacillus selangorensis]|uniref:Isoleucyl-tRNA synthetase n=1 Tax=Lactobacillus selangorensis TaxID=81857 RepID=A0A0R2FPV0_9LACO|nr:hypothetical protein [Lactobacillus selangorensis]KRN27983.1 hypothetical protein IV38_GL001824 [Lactobacillus selangorensis]KRN30546.1 hypothetical protein IV40_GL001731 [Lactobacillus selangorensis]